MTGIRSLFGVGAVGAAAGGATLIAVEGPSEPGILLGIVWTVAALLALIDVAVKATATRRPSDAEATQENWGLFVLAFFTFFMAAGLLVSASETGPLFRRETWGFFLATAEGRLVLAPLVFGAFATAW